MNELLLDTCALIWVLGGDTLAPQAIQAINNRPVHVSAISALEIAILMRSGKFKVHAAPAAWFHTCLRALSATLQPLSPAVLFASQRLPGPIHGDPFDRIVIATARSNDLTVITRDRAMLDYCRDNGVKSMVC